MFTRTTLASIAACVALITMSGCAVTRDQSTVGAYIDDTAITTAVKARFVENKDVDATSISVETLNGTVMLSGFAKSSTEKVRAEELAMPVKGVKSVRNEIALRS
jgi:osmotically-inducible protein OsmY